MKCMGIIGGLGPAATVSFMSTVLASTPLERTGRHLHLIVDCNPGVPDVNAAVLGLGESPLDDLRAMARRLAAAGADFLVMACNAAHLYEEGIRDSVAIPLLSMVDVACDHIAGTLPAARRVGLIATDGGIACGIYQRALARRGIETLVPSGPQTEAVMATLALVRAGDLGPSVKRSLIGQVEALAEAGAECVIAGCTEIPLVLAPGDTRTPVVDPSECLARAAVAFAIGQERGAAPLAGRTAMAMEGDT